MGLGELDSPSGFNQSIKMVRFRCLYKYSIIPRLKRKKMLVIRLCRAGRVHHHQLDAAREADWEAKGKAEGGVAGVGYYHLSPEHKKWLRTNILIPRRCGESVVSWEIAGLGAVVWGSVAVSESVHTARLPVRQLRTVHRSEEVMHL